MAQTSGFWDIGTGDGTAGGYTETQWYKLFRALFLSDTADEGVLKNYLNGLAVSGVASPLDVATGGALVAGLWYVNDAATTIVVPTPASSTRIDRIVLEATWSAQTVRIARVAGVEGGAAPSLTQSLGTTWQIPLAQASITTGGVITVTDQRVYAHYNTEVETAMIANDAVTNAKVANDAANTGQIANDAVTNAKLANMTRGTVKVGGTSDAPTDLDAKTSGYILVGDGTDVKSVAVSGDVTMTSTGVVTIANGAVETVMLADDAVTQATLGADTLRQLIIKLEGTERVLPYNTLPGNFVGNVGHQACCRLTKEALPASVTVKFFAYAAVDSAGGRVTLQLRNDADAIVVSLAAFTSTTPTLGLSSDIYSSLSAGTDSYHIWYDTSGYLVNAQLHGAGLLIEW